MGSVYEFRREMYSGFFRHVRPIQLPSSLKGECEEQGHPRNQSPDFDSPADRLRTPGPRFELRAMFLDL